MAITNLVPRIKCKIINGSFVFKNPELVRNYLNKFEGKEVSIKIDQSQDNRKEDLYALYFGIIIRNGVMKSEQFQTYFDENEIHQMLQKELRSFITIIEIHTENGLKRQQIKKIEDVLNYNRNDFLNYINDVILFLETEFGIVVKNYNDYIVDKKRKTNTLKK